MNINIGMSNFEVVEARKNGVPFTDIIDRMLRLQNAIGKYLE